MKTAFAIVAGLVALSANARAQVLTPPPAETPTRDRYIPRAPAPAPVEQKVAQPQPARPQQQMPELPTDVNYEALVQRDADGRIVPLTEPVYIAALRKNPRLDPNFWEKATPFLAQRRNTVEFVMINNLDLIEKVDDGVFENTPFKPEETQKLLATVRPLMAPAGPESLLKDLRKQGMVDDLQYRVTDQIVRRYAVATNPPPPKDLPKEQRGADSWRTLLQLYKLGFEEYTFYYNEMKQAAIVHMDEVLPKLGLDASTSGKVREIGARLRTAPDAAARDQLFRDLRNVLDLDQRKAFFREVVSIMQRQRTG